MPAKRNASMAAASSVAKQRRHEGQSGDTKRNDEIDILPSKKFQDIVKSLKKGRTWEDPDFTMTTTIELERENGKTEKEKLFWKRPSEIVDKPIFDLGADTVDVDQGSLGDCFFLGAIANLTSHKKLFRIIVPPGQTFDSGIFRFHFWSDGGYMEVLVDDRLPCTQNGGQFQLAYTTSPRREFWASLLEKAFAKLKGGYAVIDKGGFIENSFEALTGHKGTIEKLEGYRNNPTKQKTLHSKLVHSLEAGALVGTGIDKMDKETDKDREDMGLVLAHQYTVLDAATVCKNHLLVYIRNPWGNETEWRGAWSDKSRKWNCVTDEEKERLHYHVGADGEFWMSMDDFVTEFDDVEICMLNDLAKK